MILSDRARPDLVAILAVVVLGLAQILTPQETFSGFSSSAVITILAIFVLAEGLQKTGVADLAGKALLKVAGEREKWLVTAVTITGAFLSLFMNNIAAAVVLLPAVNGVTRKTRISPAHLMIPLAFGTILGGMATLFTSSNLVVSSILRDQGLEGYGVFDFLPLGIPIVLTGGLYLVLWGHRYLKSNPRLNKSHTIALPETNLADIYHLNERLVWARIPFDSPLKNLFLGQSQLREQHRINVIAIRHDHHTDFAPGPGVVLKAGDYLWIEAHPEDLKQDQLRDLLQFPVSPEQTSPRLEEQNYILVEAVLTPRSSLIGRSLRDSRFREKYGMEVIAIWRSGRPYRTRLSDFIMQFGDALILYGRRTQIDMLHAEADLVLLGDWQAKPTARGLKTWFTLGVMVLAITITAFKPGIIAEVMLGAALLLILGGVLSMEEAYRSVEWRTIFLVAGMLPMGVAMTKTGAATTLANTLGSLSGGWGPMALLAGIVIVSMLLTQAINGVALAAIMTPIAIQIANQAGVNPRAMAMGVALGISLKFLTSVGHPVNTLVMGPGGYRSRDYFRVGAPLTLILSLVIIGLLPFIWHF